MAPKVGPYSKEQVEAFYRSVEHAEAPWQDKGNATLQVKLESLARTTISYYTTNSNVFFQGKKDAQAREAFLKFVQTPSDSLTSAPGSLRAASAPPCGPLVFDLTGEDDGGAQPEVLEQQRRVLDAPVPTGPPTAAPCPTPGQPCTPAPPQLVQLEADTETINFGKHSGSTFRHVFESEPNYVSWALSQETPGGGLQKFADYCRRRNELAPPPAPLAAPVRALKRQRGAATRADSAPPATRSRKEGGAVAALPVLPPDGIYDFYIFFDGSCPNNVVTSASNPAGFGVVVYENPSRLLDAPENRRTVQTEAHKRAELSGPVVTRRGQGSGGMLDPRKEDPDFFIGSETGSNNTGELSGLAEALLWLLEFAPGRSALLLYDSQYAARACSGRNQIHQNKELAEFGKFLLHRLRSLKAAVHFEHVKGHSGQVGNETADRLANCGAQGSFSRSGRFATGTESTVKTAFSEFIQAGGRTQSFYCNCSAPARSCTAAGGPNAGKDYSKCATEKCDFWSWA